MSPSISATVVSMSPSRSADRKWLLAVLLVGPFMAQADATIANVATPSIHADLGASGAALELVIGAYLVAFAAFLITGARLGQTLGYRRVFLGAVSAFGLASLACGLAPTPAALVAARAVQGAAAGLMFPQTLTGIQLNFERADRVRAVGLYATALSVGAVAGQILGGVLISADLGGTEWRAVFLVNVPVAAITVVLGLRRLPAEIGHDGRRFDFLGVVMLTATALALVLPLSVGQVEGWPLWTWLCLAASVPAAAIFVADQRRLAARGGSPLVNIAVLATPPVGWALLALLIATGTYYALLFTLAQYLQGGLGRSALVSGLTLVPWVAAFGRAGKVVRRWPAGRSPTAPVFGCLLLATAYAAISILLFAGHRGEVVLVVFLAAGGLGLGINFSALIAHLTSSVPPGYAADVSGVTSTAAALGGAIGVAAFGTLYLSMSHVGPAGAGHAFAVVAASLAAAALVAAGMAWRATRPVRSPTRTCS